MGTWNEADHPRVGAGAAGGEGGRFEDKPVVGDDADLTGGDETAGMFSPDEAMDAMADYMGMWAQMAGPGMTVDVDRGSGRMRVSDAGSGRTVTLSLSRSDKVGFGDVFHVELEVPGSRAEPAADVWLRPPDYDEEGFGGVDGPVVEPYGGDPFRWAANYARHLPSADPGWSQPEESEMTDLLDAGWRTPQLTGDGWAVPPADEPCPAFDRTDELCEAQVGRMAAKLREEYGVDVNEARRQAEWRWWRGDAFGSLKRKREDITRALRSRDGDDVRPLAEWAANRGDALLQAWGRGWLSSHRREA